MNSTSKSWAHIVLAAVYKMLGEILIDDTLSRQSLLKTRDWHGMVVWCQF